MYPIFLPNTYQFDQVDGEVPLIFRQELDIAWPVGAPVSCTRQVAENTIYHRSCRNYTKETGLNDFKRS